MFNQIELSVTDKCKLFDTLVGSILNYSAEVWGYHESKDIELVHCKFLRKVLCVKKSTNLEGLYGELGRYPLKIQRTLILIKYWLKIINSDNSLIKTMYTMMKDDVENNITYGGMNWAFQIKNILIKIGMNNLWQNQDNLPNNLNYKNIKQRIIDIHMQNWYTIINNSRRLSSYCIYKHEFNSEKYLNCIKTNKYRIALSKFRLSSHNLEIETGRHTNIAREDRKCKICNTNAIENEYHFLLVCSKYRELRLRYLKPYYCHWPTLKKIENLMSSESVFTINCLSKYLYYAFQLRSQNENI